LFSLFGCCVSPDTSNSGDEETENVHKLDRLPQRPTTSKAPAQQDEQLNKPHNEKESQPQGTASTREQRTQPGNGHDQITVAENEDRDANPPAVTVDPPKTLSVDEEPQASSKAAAENDTAMDDVPPEDPQASIITQANEDPGSRTIPPPPPPAGHSPTAVTPATEDVPSAGEPQKALLGPIRPEHRGRKCLVLDLDETLVHSSFKVWMSDVTLSDGGR
jgi:RNA polymerase II subunit A small phosphatase-like protein